MMRDVVHALETGHLAQIGLVAFFVAFVLVIVYAFTLSRSKREDLKNQPLDNLPRVDGGDDLYAS